jgi:hypothetical protein
MIVFIMTHYPTCDAMNHVDQGRQDRNEGPILSNSIKRQSRSGGRHHNGVSEAFTKPAFAGRVNIVQHINIEVNLVSKRNDIVNTKFILERYSLTATINACLLIQGKLSV